MSLPGEGLPTGFAQGGQWAAHVFEGRDTTRVRVCGGTGSSVRAILTFENRPQTRVNIAMLQGLLTVSDQRGRLLGIDLETGVLTTNLRI